LAGYGITRRIEVHDLKRWYPAMDLEGEEISVAA
jgi:hypothetical protein